MAALRLPFRCRTPPYPPYPLCFSRNRVAEIFVSFFTADATVLLTNVADARWSHQSVGSDGPQTSPPSEAIVALRRGASLHKLDMRISGRCSRLCLRTCRSSFTARTPTRSWLREMQMAPRWWAVLDPAGHMSPLRRHLSEPAGGRELRAPWKYPRMPNFQLIEDYLYWFGTGGNNGDVALSVPPMDTDFRGDCLPSMVATPPAIIGGRAASSLHP